MAITDGERLRQLLGESIPAGGVDEDTLFSDDMIDDILTRYPDIYEAAAEGWRIKAAKLADLVNTNESGTSRSMSDLHKHALEMAKYFGGQSVTVGEAAVDRGRVKIRNITRPEDE